MQNNITDPGDDPRLSVPSGMPGSIGSPLGSYVSENLLQVLLRYNWIILSTVIVVLIAGFCLLLKTVPRYSSESRLYVEQSGPRIMTEMEKGVMTDSKNYLYTQAELIKASPILLEALKKLDAQRLQTFSNVHNHLQFLKNSLATQVGSKDDIITVSFTSPHAAEAAFIVNTVVDAYVTYHRTRKRNTAAEVLRLLNQEKEKRGQERSQLLRAMMEFKQANEGLAFQSDKGNMIVERIGAILQALTQAELVAMEAQSAYDAAQQLLQDPNRLADYLQTQHANYLGSPRFQEKARLKAKLEQFKLQRSNRRRELTPDHPAILALNSEIASIEGQIKSIDDGFKQAQIAAFITEKEQAYLTAKEKQQHLARHYAEQRDQTLELTQQVSEYTILEQEWEQAKSICDILDNRIKELNVTEDAGVLNISILEVALAADKPSEPQRAVFMTKALILGLMLGIGLAFLRNMMDRRIRSADEVLALLGTPLLGTVPAMSKRQSLADKGQKMAKEAKSSVAEAFRTVRTAVFFSLPKDRAHSIQITSPLAGEGKSTLASNLSIAIAQSGQRVLLIDADFRHPTQHAIFKIDRENGLSSVLAGLQPLKQAICPTGTKGLDLLTSGPDVPNPAEMLGSQAFRQMLTKLASHYDRIIVDSAPIVPVADGSILAAACDASIMVVRAEQSTRNGLQHARTTLASADARVMGAVVNDVKHGSGRYGYYSYGYRYGYHYGYGHGKDHEKNGGNGKKKNGEKVTTTSRLNTTVS